MSDGKKLTKRLMKKKNNDCFWMENIFCLESHIHLCSRHTSAIPAYVIKTCVTWHAIFEARYWGFVSPKLHVSTYRNQQHCWWFHYGYAWLWILNIHNWVMNIHDGIMGIHICILISITNLRISKIQLWISTINYTDVHEGLKAIAFPV